MVHITINGVVLQVEDGLTVLEAAHRAGIYIPALCAHPDLGPLSKSRLEPEDFIYQGEVRVENELTSGALDSFRCELCLIEVEGQDELVTACDTEVVEGMIVHTDTPRIQKRRKERLQHILGRHPNICITCDRVPRCPPFGVCIRSATVTKRCVACPVYANCELLKLADYIGMTGITILTTTTGCAPISDNPFFEFDPDLCIGCLRCVRFCKDVRGVGALGFVVKDGKVEVGTKGPTFEKSGCMFCLACVEVCPTGALVDKKEKWRPLAKREEREAYIVPCSNACPLGIDVPRYIYYISRKQFAEALAVVRERLPFPLLCGTVCFHPCEAVCRRAEIDQPVAIRNLKRFIAEHVPNVDEKPPGKLSGKQVAIVGSGPAGLTAAYYLAKKGHCVTIFEALPEPGGMPFVGIPRFRLPKEILRTEIDRVLRLGVEIETNHRVESVEDLFSQGFDAVLLALGAHGERHLDVEGEDDPRVTGALSVLRKVNLGETIEVGKKVIVVGGGNVAVDVARVLVRLGAKEVLILYRRSEAEMPANAHEVSEAKEEGVRLMFRVAPLRVSSKNGSLELECIRTRLGRRDSSGRRSPEPVPGTEFAFEADMVITAIGQIPQLPANLALPTNTDGTLKVDLETLMTPRKGVFAAGDVVTGPRTVTEAIAMGRQVASAIDIYLGGTGDVTEVLAPLEELSPLIVRTGGFSANRHPMPSLPLERRLRTFEQIELGFTEDAAVNEAARCLRCNLRLTISKWVQPLRNIKLLQQEGGAKQ